MEGRSDAGTVRCTEVYKMALRVGQMTDFLHDEGHVIFKPQKEITG
jgi:hypothetical protein